MEKITQTIYGIGGWMPDIEGENILEIVEIEVPDVVA